MNKLTNIFLGIIAITSLAVLLPKKQLNTFGGGISSVRTYSSTSVSTTTVGPTIVQVIGANPNRIYLQIDNNSPSFPLFCLLDGATTSSASRVSSTVGATTGFQIGMSSTTATSYSNSVWENSGYTGIINCTASANASVTIITSP